jgi:sulfur relay (sulfurtransferase) complex TusBCD TusD component (DsrE family)
VVDEKDGEEVEKGDQVRYCVECALAKGYAHYREEKGERTLTFMP